MISLSRPCSANCRAWACSFPGRGGACSDCPSPRLSGLCPGSPHPPVVAPPGPSVQGREQHKQVAHPVALVFVIVGHGTPDAAARGCGSPSPVACWSRPGTPAPRCPRTDGDTPPEAQTNSALALGGLGADAVHYLTLHQPVSLNTKYWILLEPQNLSYVSRERDGVDVATSGHNDEDETGLAGWDILARSPVALTDMAYAHLPFTPTVDGIGPFRIRLEGIVK